MQNNAMWKQETCFWLGFKIQKKEIRCVTSITSIFFIGLVYKALEQQWISQALQIINAAFPIGFAVLIV